MFMRVLNLIITGIPSILLIKEQLTGLRYVLNLIITGIPSIPLICLDINKDYPLVLNLIITGIPSILCSRTFHVYGCEGF